MLRRTARLIVSFFAIVFLLPALLSTGLWVFADRPQSWRQADWSSAGTLTPAGAEPEAVIYVMSARTGGLKGALSSHSWIVLKRKGSARYDRYDKVGWGSPVRLNAYAADARWYSNEPVIIKAIRGEKASRLIPQIEATIAAYPHAKRGGYTIWPGPNSNSFIAHILREVPDLDAILPPDAVGRDYLGEGKYWFQSRRGDEFKLGWRGLVGISIGRLSGFEVNLLGLVAGIDVARPALKLPGFGRITAN